MKRVHNLVLNKIDFVLSATLGIYMEKKSKNYVALLYIYLNKKLTWRISSGRKLSAFKPIIGVVKWLATRLVGTEGFAAAVSPVFNVNELLPPLIEPVFITLSYVKE